MAESSLGLTFTQLKLQVAMFLGYGSDSSKWGTNRTNDVENIVASGLRRFYWPDPDPETGDAIEWSFLKPVTTIATVSDQGDYDLPDDFGGILGDLTFDPQEAWYPIEMVNEGVIRGLRQTTYYQGGTLGRPVKAAVRPKKVPYQAQTVTLTGTSGTANITLDATDYLATFDTDLETTADNWVSANSSALATAGYTVSASSGVITVTALAYSTDVDVSVATQSGDLDGTVAEVIDGSEGQRFELMLWPNPDGVYTLSYAYDVLPDTLSNGTPYPYGGAAHAETILESCLAVAEHRKDDEEGTHAARFAARLRTSVKLDSKRNRAESFGYNGDPSTEMGGRGIPWPRSNYSTFKGVRY